MLLEFDPRRTPKSKSDIDAAFRDSSPLLRLRWPRDFPNESVRIQKSQGLEMKRAEILPASFVFFDRFDPIRSIRIHIRPGDGPVKPAPLMIEFLSNSDRSCQLPIYEPYGSLTNSTNTNHILAFDLDHQRGEELISCTVFYEKILDMVGLDEIVDFSFATNFGRSSPRLQNWPLNVASYEVNIKAPAGEEPCLAGIYSNNQSYHSRLGALTYRAVGAAEVASDIVSRTANSIV